jgi:hypothetical protein
MRSKLGHTTKMRAEPLRLRRDKSWERKAGDGSSPAACTLDAGLEILWTGMSYSVLAP